MKNLMVAVALAFAFATAGAARAADKPDCSAQEAALTAAKGVKVDKADLSSCKDKKGKEKTECEKPLKDAVTEAKKANADKVKAAKKDVDCCKNPKGKGCDGAAK